MKRLNKTIIAVIVFILSFSTAASAAASYDNSVNLFDSDPTYFDLTEDEQNEFPYLVYNGKICVEYTKDKGTDSEKRVRCYCAVYSNYENFGAYMYQEEGSSGDLLVYLQYKYNIGDKIYIKWGSDLNDYNFVKLIDNYWGYSDVNRGFFYSYGYSGNSTISYSGNNAYDATVVSTEFPIFSNSDDLLLYRQTGKINNALYNPIPKDYSSELYFKSFEVIPHVSNSAEYYYFDIKYELSDYAKRNIKNLNLNFENNYYWESENIVQSVNSYYNTGWKANSIALGEFPYGFTIYVSKLGSIVYAHNIWGLSYAEIVGTTKFWDLTNSALNALVSSQLGTTGTDLKALSVSNIYLYFKFNLRFNNNGNVVIGKRNDFTYDFLTKETKAYLYVPDTQKDADGNTIFVKDDNNNISYTQEGDTKTSKDYYSQEGDKYYYTDNNGSKKEITEDVYNNSSASIGDININVGDSSGQYITISPVDFNQFAKGVEELLKMFDTGGGLFLLIKDVLSMYPNDVQKIAIGAISAVAIVSIFCILRRK